MHNEVVGIIQARMGSTRLPGKSMMMLGDNLVIDWVINRCLMSNRIYHLYVSIPDSRTDDELAECIGQNDQVSLYRGSEDNVINRFYGVTSKLKNAIVVRVCADRPLVCPALIDEAIDYYLINDCDLAYNHRSDLGGHGNVPFGFGVEVFSSVPFNRIVKTVTSNYDKEHVTPQFYTENYNHKFVPQITDMQLHGKYDLDDQNDFDNLTAIISNGVKITDSYYDIACKVRLKPYD